MTDLEAAVVALTAELIAIDSVSPSLVPDAAGEARIAAHLAQRLAASGFGVQLVAAPADERRVSVLATRTGSRPGRTIVLNGHLDTVGVEDMREPFEPRIEGDRMLGRGASDMKGGVAGLVVAAEQLAAEDAPGTIILALVADEEDASLGAETVIAELQRTGVTADACLIAEPTWLQLAAAHRGYLTGTVLLEGRASHSSQPEQGIDAIAGLRELLVGVHEAHQALQAKPAHPLLGHGSLMATVVEAGTAPFTVAAAAGLVVERRTLPGEHTSDVMLQLHPVIERTIGAVPGLTADVRFTLARDAWELDDEGPAAQLATFLGEALAASGTAPERTGAPYWMESALWQAAGVPAVVCGPAGGGLHAIDEWVDLAQLRRYPAAVVAAVRRFLEAT